MLINHRVIKEFCGVFFRMSPVSGKYLFSDTDMKEYGGGKRDFFVLTLMVNLYPFFLNCEVRILL